MRTRSKLLLAGLAAALLLATAVANSTAGRLSVSNRAFTITWSSLHLGSGGGINVNCPITLSGSFHSATLSKVAGALMGSVVRGTFNNGGCTGGRATIDQESLPWHIRYRAFRGTLPTITGVDFSIVATKVTVEVSGSTCTTSATVTNPDVGVLNLTTGRITSFTVDPATSIPLRGAFFCSFAGNAIVEGTSTTITNATVTLI